MSNPSHFTDMDLKGLVKVVAAWIAYRSLVGRSNFFSERALAEPIGDFLFSNFRAWEAVAEEAHPSLNENARRGRPKQIDYVLKQKDSLKLALETKWAPAPPDALLQDLARLVAIRSDGNQARNIYRGFLLCGNSQAFQAVFSRQANAGSKREDHISKFLSIEKNRRMCSISAKDVSEQQWKRWEKVFEDVQGAGKTAEAINTTLCHLVSSSGFTTAAWQVNLRRGRKPAT
jgi:hypothetical protein